VGAGMDMEVGGKVSETAKKANKKTKHLASMHIILK
jgi:hypothetical protein